MSEWVFGFKNDETDLWNGKLQMYQKMSSTTKNI